MSKKNSSSIRKKIVRGYVGMYCFLAILLFVIFIAGVYVTVFYGAQEYLRNDLEKVLSAAVEYKKQGLAEQELYEKTQEIMPGYVVRYDIIEELRKTKEEDYYDNGYYHGIQDGDVDSIDNYRGEPEPLETLSVTATPMPSPAATQSEAASLEYDEADLTNGYVTATKLYIRDLPDIDADIIYKVYYGAQVSIIEDLGEWYKIYYEGQELYAVSKLVSLGPVPTPTPGYPDEYWASVNIHLFSGKGPDYTTESAFDYDQLGNAVLSLKEPYTFYITAYIHEYDEAPGQDYVLSEYYMLKAVVDITDVVPYHIIWSVAGGLLVAAIVLFFIGIIIVWLYGATKTKKYLKPINEITRLANEIQPNSQYRLDVETAKYELKELVITINNMLDRLNAAHIKRKKFVSDVSHELRTPISVIAGYANMLKRWAKDDEAVFDESVNAIIDESSNMKYLVENLLFLARSDNDQNVYEMEQFDISSLIETICKDSRMVDKGKHEILCDIQQGVIINGDRNRLKQAFREFLLNAIKYTPPTGEIKFSLQNVAGKAIISIKDTGMGISKKDMGHIFTRFYRGDVSRNRDKGGYGLGLAICREIISAHKGKITFKSKEGAGTEVIVTLDLA